MIRYAITGIAKDGVRINIFTNGKTYPTLKGVRRAMLTYEDSFSPDVELRYEEVEVETELETTQKQLSQKDEMISLLEGALVNVIQSDCNEYVYNTAEQTLAKLNEMRGGE